MSSPSYAATQLLSTAELTYRNTSDVVEDIGDQFPASNVADAYPGTVCKFPRLEAGAIVAQWTSSTTWNCVAWLNHNLSSDVVLKVQKSNDGVTWTDVQTGISLTSTRYWVTFASQSSTWFRMLLTSMGTQAAIPYFGELWVGYLVTMSRNFSLGPQVGDDSYSVGGLTTWGRPWGYAKTRGEVIEGLWAGGLSSSELDEIKALTRAVQMPWQPFLWVRNTATAAECWIARLANVESWRASNVAAGFYSDVPLQIAEIPFGKPVS